MATQELKTASTAGLRRHLALLERERATAALSGLADNELFLADLSEEITAVRSAYVGAAVTEIASLRAFLGAPLVG